MAPETLLVSFGGSVTFDGSEMQWGVPSPSEVWSRRSLFG